ncbi:hypothetical protein [Enhygromyxa salina]|uniref:hypothetical protein n=1 Tax=Enhygromyxa salina TaxID=215803 RepID=UPI000D08C231|nr:hypothetical protein [Enhygromyxa salina]
MILSLAACGDDGGREGSIFTDDSGATTLDTSMSDETAEGDGAEDPGEGDGEGDSGEGADAPGDGDGDGEGDGDDGPLFDIGGQEAGDDGVPMDEQCANVDVLYIIDNSPSMYEEQQTLIANFGNFVADMQSALDGVNSYHIGVITSDDYQDDGWIDDGDDTVNAEVPECQHLGGLVVQAHSGLCTPFVGGDNFITEADDLGTKFECIANVGEDGDSDEYMGDALITLLAEGQQDVGCNANFIRDDAMLIIVMLTDENDSSDSDEDEWFQAVVDAKGTEENVVVLSLIWDGSFNNCDNAFSETDGYTIEAFTEMFTNHAVGNICDDSYAGFFADAIPTIDSACDNFEPIE